MPESEILLAAKKRFRFGIDNATEEFRAGFVHAVWCASILADAPAGWTRSQINRSPINYLERIINFSQDNA